MESIPFIVVFHARLSSDHINNITTYFDLIFYYQLYVIFNIIIVLRTFLKYVDYKCSSII